MKKTSLVLSILLLFAGGVWSAEDEKRIHYMEVLSACSDSEVKEVVGLFVGTNLDLSCVKTRLINSMLLESFVTVNIRSP